MTGATVDGVITRAPQSACDRVRALGLHPAGGGRPQQGTVEALTDWRAELQAKDTPGKASRVDPETSVPYTGAQPLDSKSAHSAADQQVGKAVTIADLGGELGFSAGSLRLWAAARHVTDGPSLFTGAEIAGIDAFVLHRQITRGADRGRRR